MAAVAHPTRPHIRRNSPLSAFNPTNGFSADPPMMKRIEVGDDSDSDDEPPPAIKFSKVTQALLADEGVASSPPKHDHANDAQRYTRAAGAAKSELDTPSRAPGIRIMRRSSPSANAISGQQERGHTPPRIVHLGGSTSGSAKRSISISGPYPQRPATRRQPTPESGLKSEVVTPAQAPRAIRVVTRSRAGSNASQEDRSNLASSISRPSSRNVTNAAPNTGERKQQAELSRSASQYNLAETASRYAPSTVARSRNPSAEAPPPGSQRIKRAPIGTGTFLRSGPVRRGFRRRDSEENVSSQEEAQHGSASQPSATSYTPQERRPKVHTDASEDQENVPPPTFKRNREQEFKYLGKPTMAVASDDEKPKPMPVEETPVPVPQQEQRKALGTISGNTPHRPAPAPPPKMSVLDAATTTAGAGTTKSRKKRQHMVVNGKIFTQMGKIGKGGSSDVYCVMAENYKTFALKRVKLEDCDEHAVRGFKGEIDLLKKLTEVERVVRLFDWEMNEEKQELIVLMEKGDTDLNRLLTLRLNGVDAKYDPTFTRYHWKEMLECVQAVHEHDIVHSDLKPANFLLVQGRLKLIDFGIANAIDTDNTVNVHRDSHVGTPNYMSPESITDTNANSSGRDEAGRPLKKDMRIGKSSDVWSLGCILYQMTYGRPPFAHISNQISRIMAITNPKHIIEYPETGVGGARIPSTLIGTLRRCLNRDPERRPKILDMLSETDPYLNPEGPRNSIVMTDEVLSQIIHKIIERCKDPKRGPPTPDESNLYAKTFLDRIRAKHEGL
ncbi:hypothetical protein PRZ48_001720 [Zasmidium cellare]|uniref:Protein kinase domain-containing protein n=1 Tax=Zasmidium cellare TaxID=395010 RepID=A0ABR0F3K1_ZASCE|nr:hypothetical protein PRZ48_001720 [Zasmidium cellare]